MNTTTTTQNVHTNEINIDNSRFSQDQKKLQNYYQDYINNVEGENDRLRSQINQLRSSLGKNNYYREEIMRINNEIVNIKGPDNSSLMNLLKNQIMELNQEKLRLVDLIDKNKTQINQVEKNFTEKSTLKQVVNNEHLYKEIAMLEDELRNIKEEVVVQEKVVYIENPANVERIVQKKPVVHIKENLIEEGYNKNCICQCKCSCHATHCNEHTLQKFEEITLAPVINKTEVKREIKQAPVITKTEVKREIKQAPLVI